MIGEELVRAAFWFHPLVWWAVGQVQLAREEVVDREVVRFTSARDRYLETLLEIAAAKAGVELAVAPLFLRNRHLRQRVASLLKEVPMSRKRLNLSLAGFFAALVLGGWLAIHSFPLQGAPQEAGATLAESGLRVTHKTPPQYPAEAKENHIEGDVTIKVQVDEHGLVSDAQALSGPEELRQAALTSVRQWTFATDSRVPGSAQVVIAFRLEPNGDTDQPFHAAQADGMRRIRVGGNVQSSNLVTKITPIYPPEAKAARVQGKVRLNVLISEEGRVLDVVLIDGEPVLAEAAIKAVRDWVYRPTLLNGEPIEVLTQVDVNFTLLP